MKLKALMKIMEEFEAESNAVLSVAIVRSKLLVFYGAVCIGDVNFETDVVTKVFNNKEGAANEQSNFSR